MSTRDDRLSNIKKKKLVLGRNSTSIFENLHKIRSWNIKKTIRDKKQ